jgi:hypothetical protein
MTAASEALERCTRSQARNLARTTETASAVAAAISLCMTELENAVQALGDWAGRPKCVNGSEVCREAEEAIKKEILPRLTAIVMQFRAEAADNPLPSGTKSAPVSEPPLGTASSQPLYVLDRAQRNVLALSNLKSETCQPTGKDTTDQLDGVIVARQFDASGIVVTGVTLEEADGARHYANVAVEVDSMNMATKSWVIRGLQTLLKEGSRVSLGVKLCDNAGRFVMVDSVRLAQPR